MKVRKSLMSCAAVLALTSVSMCSIGCSSAQQQNAKQVVGLIGTEIPKAMPLISAASGVVSMVLPAEAPLVATITPVVQAGLIELAALCNSYASAPSESVWDSIVATVDKLVSQGGDALLDAAHISDPHSRAEAQAALGALQTALLIIDGYVQAARTKKQNTATAEARSFKLRQIEPYLDKHMVEEATGHNFGAVYSYETSLGF